METNYSSRLTLEYVFIHLLNLCYHVTADVGADDKKSGSKIHHDGYVLLRPGLREETCGILNK